MFYLQLNYSIEHRCCFFIGFALLYLYLILSLWIVLKIYDQTIFGYFTESYDVFLEKKNVSKLPGTVVQTGESFIPFLIKTRLINKRLK